MVAYPADQAVVHKEVHAPVGKQERAGLTLANRRHCGQEAVNAFRWQTAGCRTTSLERLRPGFPGHLRINVAQKSEAKHLGLRRIEDRGRVRSAVLKVEAVMDLEPCNAQISGHEHHPQSLSV